MDLQLIQQPITAIGGNVSGRVIISGDKNHMEKTL